jgi:hypothetical protein
MRNEETTGAAFAVKTIGIYVFQDRLTNLEHLLGCCKSHKFRHFHIVT